MRLRKKKTVVSFWYIMVVFTLNLPIRCYIFLGIDPYLGSGRILPVHFGPKICPFSLMMSGKRTVAKSILVAN